MPVLSTINTFSANLEELSIENIALWLQNQKNITLLENELGNKILYPQTVPTTNWSLTFDLVVLREVLRKNPKPYYNKNLSKIFIPEYFLERFPNIQQLTWAFIDVFNPVGLTTILLQTANLGTKSLGTLIKPEVNIPKTEVFVWVEGKRYLVKSGSLAMIPTKNNKVDIKFESAGNKFLSNSQMVSEVAGGLAGIIIDAR